jgi:hypothetical protein
MHRVANCFRVFRRGILSLWGQTKF